MNNLKFFTFVISMYLSLNIYCTILYYNYPLSLILLQNGVNVFLDKSHTAPEHEFKAAIKDVITLANQNKTNIPQILQELERIFSKELGELNQ